MGRPHLLIRVQQALVRLTFQGFEPDFERWLRWWDSNSNKHRTEWAIDALLFDDPVVRRHAVTEIREAMAMEFDCHESMTLHEWKEVHVKCMNLWRSNGCSSNRRSSF